MMVRRKRKGRRKVKGRPKDWHHRVPDFKLVYCGPPKPRKEIQHVHGKRLIEASVIDNGNSMAAKKPEKQKQTVTSLAS